jgi:hypothetical protein
MKVNTNPMTSSAGSTPTWVATPMIAKIIGVFFESAALKRSGRNFVKITNFSNFLGKSFVQIAT